MSPDHINHPYPSEAEKVKIMEDTGIDMKQLTNWFVNNRKRYWKPRFEAKMREEKKRKKTTSRQQVLCSLVSNDNCSEDEHVVISHHHDCKPSAVVSPQRSGSTRSSRPMSESTGSFPLLTSGTDSVSSHGSGLPPVTIRTISVNNSVVSLKDLISADDDEDDESTQKAASFKKIKPVPCRSVENQELPREKQQLKSETIDVHILSPTDGSTLPLLGDVTVLSNVPQERILRTFENCAINYYPFSGKNSSKSPRRDAEIVRIKKHYLALYLIEMAALASASSDSHVNIKKRPAISVHVVTPDASEEPALSEECPRRKYRRQSVQLWKEACQTASHVYDQNLPSLEEAAQLFGYTSGP